MTLHSRLFISNRALSPFLDKTEGGGASFKIRRYHPLAGPPEMEPHVAFRFVSLLLENGGDDAQVLLPGNHFDVDALLAEVSGKRGDIPKFVVEIQKGLVPGGIGEGVVELSGMVSPLRCDQFTTFTGFPALNASMFSAVVSIRRTRAS